ncbi:MAG: transcriptional regulator TbsP [Halanaeroarchaeum sp.]
MTASLLGTDVPAILDAVLADDPATLYVVNPSPRVLEQLAAAAVDIDELPSLRVLGDAGVLKDIMDDFLVASIAADLIERDALSLRSFEGARFSSVVVSDHRVVALVETGDAVGGLSTTDETFTESAVTAAADRWEASSSFSLRTPARSRVMTTLDDEIGEGARDDFESMLDALETARGDGDDLDEVTVSLLTAARNGVLLYDISKWGEDVGIASKATFSRTKSRLEEAGVIETEKVPIDVGRPRLRLRLAPDIGGDETPEAVVAATLDRLS